MNARVRVAVILAAGRGGRLGSRGVDRPKGFIEIAGVPIIERSLDQLAAAGITRVLIVCGHQARFYEELARRRTGVELIQNSDYARSGSMRSLFKAIPYIKEEILLLESDLIYEARTLEMLLATAPDTILVSGPTGSGDEVYVEAAGGRLTGLSKTRQDLRGEVIGELVGITRLSTDSISAMSEYAQTAFRTTLHIEYEQALVAASLSVAMNCYVVEDLVWSEIDDERQLHRAVTHVYPRIRQQDTTRAKEAAC